MAANEIANVPLRILFITECAMVPPTTGGRQRTNLLVRALSELGKVDVFWTNGNEPLTDSDHVRMMHERYNVIGQIDLQEPSDVGTWKLLRKLHPRIANQVVNFVNPADRFLTMRARMRDEFRRACAIDDYDVVVGRYLHSLARLDAFGSPPCIVDVDDFDSTMLETQLIHGEHGALHRNMTSRSLGPIRAAEKRLVENCKSVWVSTADDLNKVAGTDATLLPNIPFIAEHASAPFDAPMPVVDSHVLMTVGSMRHVPNVQGIDAFLNGPWKRILNRVPDARFRIVGSGLHDGDRERWKSNFGVEVVGFVDNLADEYARCAATVCNIPWGAGSNIKVVESLAYGRPTIVTEMALRGWDAIFDSDDGLCIARTDEDLVEIAVRLLLDRPFRERAGERARQLAQTHFSFRSFATIVESTVRRVLAGRAPARAAAE